MTLCQLMTLADQHQYVHSGTQQAAPPAAAPDASPFGLMSMASMQRN
jgi:hypothetical protein